MRLRLRRVSWRRQRMRQKISRISHQRNRERKNWNISFQIRTRQCRERRLRSGIIHSWITLLNCLNLQHVGVWELWGHWHLHPHALQPKPQGLCLKQQGESHGRNYFRKVLSSQFVNQSRLSTHLRILTPTPKALLLTLPTPRAYPHIKGSTLIGRYLRQLQCRITPRMREMNLKQSTYSISSSWIKRGNTYTKDQSNRLRIKQREEWTNSVRVDPLVDNSMKPTSLWLIGSKHRECPSMRRNLKSISWFSKMRMRNSYLSILSLNPRHFKMDFKHSDQGHRDYLS